MRILIFLAGTVATLPACAPRTAASVVPQAAASGDALAAERARFVAMSRADITALDTLLADDLLYTHTSGLVETKEEFLTSLRTRRLFYDFIAPDDLQVRRPAPDVAVITGRARMWVTLADTRQEFDIRFTDVLIRRNGRWQTMSWQSTRLPPGPDRLSTTRPPQN
jgi:hypothetical protein